MYRPVLPRKIPGPASKTIRPSLDGAGHGSFQHRIYNGQSSTGTASSPVVGGASPSPHMPRSNSRSLDAGSRKSGPGSTTSHSSKTSIPSTDTRLKAEVAGAVDLKCNVIGRTRCLFCSFPVFLKGPVKPVCEATDGFKRLKNLCCHLQITLSEGIPETDNFDSVFPFCGTCEKHVQKLWECQQIILEAQGMISNVVSEIERTVADSELLMPRDRTPNPNLSASSGLEKKRFTQLTEQILEGYRNKLLLKRKLSEMLVNADVGTVTNASFSQGTVLQDHKIKSQFERIDNEDDDVEPQQLQRSGPEPEAQRFFCRDSVGVYAGDDENIQELQYDEGVEDFVIGTYNESSCTLQISNVRGHPLEFLDPEVEIKSEKSSPSLFNPPKKFSSTSGVNRKKTRKSRRLLFHGKEIFKETTAKGSFVVCSICGHKVPVTKYGTDGMSPFAQMKSHMLQEHKSELGESSSTFAVSPAPAQPPEPLSFNCFCLEVFPCLKSLRAHKREVHPSPYYYVLECDICGKPVKGNQNNLYAHKFSHKNDQERRAAVAAGERGARHSMLGGKHRKGGRKKLPKRSKPTDSSVLSDRMFPSLRRGPGSVISMSLRKFNCHVCGRTFSRACHLAVHMKTHNKHMTRPSTRESTIQTLTKGNYWQNAVADKRRKLNLPGPSGQDVNAWIQQAIDVGPPPMDESEPLDDAVVEITDNDTDNDVGYTVDAEDDNEVMIVEPSQ